MSHLVRNIRPWVDRSVNLASRSVDRPETRSRHARDEKLPFFAAKITKKEPADPSSSKRRAQWPAVPVANYRGKRLMLRINRNPESAVALRNVNIIGAGNVSDSKIDPALAQLRAKGLLGQVTYLDIHPTLPFTSKVENAAYHKIDPQRSAYRQLADRGYLDDDTLTVIACATPWHAHYAADLAPLARVAVEKPLTMDTRSAKELLAHEGSLYPIGHQIFKAPMLEFLDRVSRGDVDVTAIAAIEYDLMETIGVGNRSVDPIVWDTGFHALEAVVATYRAVGYTCRVTPIEVTQGTYRHDGQSVSVPTAARIRACVETPMGQVELTVRLGKGLSAARKEMRCFERQGQSLATVGLTEGGHLAHQRLIEELLRLEPNMRLTLPDAVSVVQACEALQSAATDRGSYPLGSNPDWLD
jgi:hypothetical protein